MSKLITVDFHDDTLFAVQRDDGVFVAPKPICDTLGLAWNKQLERLKRDPVLAEGVTMMVIPSPGGVQETTILQLRLLPGWLFGIDASRVKPEARALVLAYKRECYDVLFRHFYGSTKPGASPPSPGRDEPVRIKRQLVTECRHVFGDRAAGSLWFALGLPTVPEMRDTPAQGSFGFTYTALPAPHHSQGSRPA